MVDTFMYMALCLSSYLGIFNQIEYWQYSSVLIVIINCIFLIFWTINLLYLSQKLRRLIKMEEEQEIEE